MNTERIKEIQQETAYPESISVQRALFKVWNECEQEKAVNKNDLLPDVSGSALTAVNMLRDCVEFGKYKAWNCEVGEKKAQEIMDSSHNGKYGRGDGFWVQVGWAISKMEQHYR